MCLAQRLRYHDDALGTDRHARYDLWRASSHRKEQRRSDSPSPNNYKSTDGHLLHNTKSCDRRTSYNDGKEMMSSSGGSGDAVCQPQHPASQVINTLSSVESVDRFLGSIDMNSATLCNGLVKDKPVTPTQQVLPPIPVSITPSPLPLPGSSAVEVPFTFGPERLGLLHHGYPLNYDLNLLPDDPIGPITLLGATQSEPGAYLFVGAHYRRTGRSRAACKVIKALLLKHTSATLVSDSVGENGKGLALNLSLLCWVLTVLEASSHQASTTLAESPAAFALSPIDVNTPAHEAAVLRPAFLLLAACQLDISRNCSSPEEKVAHANAAQELFRTVYGPNPPPVEQTNTNANALGLAFTDRGRIPSSVDNDVPIKQTPSIPTAPAATRILALEEELRVTRTAKSALETDLADARKRQERTDQSVKEAEIRSHHALRLLDTERNEYHALKRRLVEMEQKVLDMEQSAAAVETRVWGRLRDMIYDQFVDASGF